MAEVLIKDEDFGSLRDQHVVVTGKHEERSFNTTIYTKLTIPRRIIRNWFRDDQLTSEAWG